MRRLQCLDVAEGLTGLTKGQECQAKDPAMQSIQPPLRTMPAEVGCQG